MITERSTSVSSQKSKIPHDDIKKKPSTDLAQRSREEAIKARKEQQDMESTDQGSARVSESTKEKTADGEAGYKNKSDLSNKMTALLPAAKPKH
jgi:hypothetical protein